MSRAFLRASLEIYRDDVSFMRPGSRTDVNIEMLSGIGQGCPASGSIFASCINNVVRGSALALPIPRSVLVVVVDDVALFMNSFLDSDFRRTRKKPLPWQ